MVKNVTEKSQWNSPTGAVIGGIVYTDGWTQPADSEAAGQNPPKGDQPDSVLTAEQLEALDVLLRFLCESLRCPSSVRDDLMQVGRLEFCRLRGRSYARDMQAKIRRKMVRELERYYANGWTTAAGRPAGYRRSGKTDQVESDESFTRRLLLQPGSNFGAMLDRALEAAELRCPYCVGHGWWTDGIDPASVKPGYVVPENGYDRTKAETTQAWVCDRCGRATWEPKPVIRSGGSGQPKHRTVNDQRVLAYVEAGYRLHGKPKR